MGFNWPSGLIDRNSEKSVHTNFTKTVYVLPNHLSRSLKVFDHLEKFGKVLIFSFIYICKSEKQSEYWFPTYWVESEIISDRFENWNDLTFQSHSSMVCMAKQNKSN
jgi:hypothetical protein